MRGYTELQERMSHEDGARDWSDTATNQGMPRVAGRKRQGKVLS